MDTLELIERRPGVIALHGALTADSILDVRDALLARLALESGLEVDLSQVHVIDARGAELLMRLSHEALMARKPLSLVGTTRAVSDALDGLQLGRALALSSRRDWS
jgi:anti-anti-sigma regulatory factor